MYESNPAPLGRFFEAYIVAALWSSTGDDGEPLDTNYDRSDISSETLARMREDCKQFIKQNKNDLHLATDKVGYSYSSAGHDFWLNRNGHGVGYWDRGLEDFGQRLDQAATTAGPVDLYVGDDGKIWS